MEVRVLNAQPGRRRITAPRRMAAQGRQAGTARSPEVGHDGIPRRPGSRAGKQQFQPAVGTKPVMQGPVAPACTLQGIGQAVASQDISRDGLIHPPASVQHLPGHIQRPAEVDLRRLEVTAPVAEGSARHGLLPQGQRCTVLTAIRRIVREHWRHQAA